MPTSEPITRDDALLALNDRCGDDVEIVIHVEGAETNPMVMAARGELRHWRESDDGGAWAAHPREDITGLYDIGNASFDITELGDVRYIVVGDGPPHGLAFDLGPNAALTVVWGLRDDQPA